MIRNFKDIKKAVFETTDDNLFLEWKPYLVQALNDIELIKNFKSKHNHSLNHRGNKPAEISLALKHYEALRNITTMDVSYAMIIEDDCVFNHVRVSLLVI